MQIQIFCPNCNNKAVLPDTALGKTAKCGKCMKAFVITKENAPTEASKAAPQIAAEKEDDGFQDLKVETVDPSSGKSVHEERKEAFLFCSACGNQMHLRAVICPKCGVPTRNFQKGPAGQGTTAPQGDGSPQHKTLLDAYGSRQGCGLFDLIPGIRDLTYAVKYGKAPMREQEPPESALHRIGRLCLLAVGCSVLMFVALLAIGLLSNYYNDLQKSTAAQAEKEEVEENAYAWVMFKMLEVEGRPMQDYLSLPQYDPVYIKSMGAGQYRVRYGSVWVKVKHCGGELFKLMEIER